MMATETDTGTPISVTVVPTLRDYLSFTWRFAFRRLRVLVVLSLFWLFVFLSALFLPGLERKPNNFFFILVALLLPLFTFVVLPVSIYRTAQQRWNSAAELREQRTYTFTDAGIEVNGTTFSTFLAWSNITSAQRLGAQAVLGTAQEQFYLLPIRAFGAGDEWNQFRQLVKTKVSESRL